LSDGDVSVVDGAGHAGEGGIVGADVVYVVVCADHAIRGRLGHEILEAGTGGDVDDAIVITGGRPAVFEVRRNDFARGGNLLLERHRGAVAFREPEIAVGMDAAAEIEIGAGKKREVGLRKNSELKDGNTDGLHAALELNLGAVHRMRGDG